jgi:hypothetical protein
VQQCQHAMTMHAWLSAYQSFRRAHHMATTGSAMSCQCPCKTTYMSLHIHASQNWFGNQQHVPAGSTLPCVLQHGCD